MAAAMVPLRLAVTVHAGRHLRAIARIGAHGRRALRMRHAFATRVTGRQGLRMGERRSHQLQDQQQ